MVYQLEAEQRFPHRIKIGLRAVGWVESEIQAWLAQRVQKRPQISFRFLWIIAVQLPQGLPCGYPRKA